MTSQRNSILIFTSSYPHPHNPVYGIFIRDFVYSVKDSIRTVLLTPLFPETAKQEDTNGIRIIRFSQCCPAGKPLAGNPGGILPALKRTPFLLFFLPFFLLSEFLALVSAVKKENIGIIHAHWLVPQGFLAAVWKVIFDRRIKLIITCHGSDVNKVNGGILSILKRFTLKHADEIIAVGTGIQKKIQETVPEICCQVRPMGVNMNLFHPGITEPDIRRKFGIEGRFILFAGSLFELKGVRALLQGFALLHADYPDLHIVFAGDGELRTELTEQAEKMGLASFVHLPGAVPHDQLPAFFAQSDVFILPSFSEGMPMVVLEALACGTTAVISELPALLQLDPAENLFYVCKAGDPESIANALKKALDGPRNIEECRSIAENSFSLQKTAEFYLQIYRNMLS